MHGHCTEKVGGVKESEAEGAGLEMPCREGLLDTFDSKTLAAFAESPEIICADRKSRT